MKINVQLPYTLPLLETIGEDIPDPGASVEEIVARRQLLERMFAGLDTRQAKILLMVAEGYETAEIAEKLGLELEYARELVAAIKARARGFKGEL